MEVWARYGPRVRVRVRVGAVRLRVGVVRLRVEAVRLRVGES